MLMLMLMNSGLKRLWLTKKCLVEDNQEEMDTECEQLESDCSDNTSNLDISVCLFCIMPQFIHA